MENLTTQERVTRARKAYEEFRFQDIIALLKPELEPDSLITNDELRTEARALLGAALFQQSQLSADPVQRDALEARAYDQMLTLLREDPYHRLDPYLFAVSVTDFFERVRQEHSDELDQLTVIPDKQDDSTGASVIYVERAVQKRRKLLVFAPFAFGQFQNNQEVKGTLLATGQVIGLAANVAAYTRNVLAIRDLPGGRFPRNSDNSAGAEVTTAQNFSVIQYAGLATFALFYAISVIDGLYFYEPEELLQIKTLDGPPPELLPQNRLPRLTPQLNWSWSF